MGIEVNWACLQLTFVACAAVRGSIPCPVCAPHDVEVRGGMRESLEENRPFGGMTLAWPHVLMLTPPTSSIGYLHAPYID